MVCLKKTYPFPTSHLSICFYERGITPCQWSVVRAYFQDTLLQEGIYLPISYFLLIHLLVFPLIHLLVYCLNYTTIDNSSHNGYRYESLLSEKNIESSDEYINLCRNNERDNLLKSNSLLDIQDNLIYSWYILRFISECVYL